MVYALIHSFKHSFLLTPPPGIEGSMYEAKHCSPYQKKLETSTACFEVIPEMGFPSLLHVDLVHDHGVCTHSFRHSCLLTPPLGI
jgi:hypothetical protein